MDGRVTVQENNGTRYIEVEGVRYESNDLPEAGTDVEALPFTWVCDISGVDVKWSTNTPARFQPVSPLVIDWHARCNQDPS